MEYSGVSIPQTYMEPIPISTAKKNDLISLCKSNIIRQEHHMFYENLPSAQQDDRLDCPDVDESESESESENQ